MKSMKCEDYGHDKNQHHGYCHECWEVLKNPGGYKYYMDAWHRFKPDNLKWLEEQC